MSEDAGTNRNLVLKASAGTGKTFAIATRYLRLLIFEDVNPATILALTFSRAAAQEIYAKILERLWTAAGANVSPTKEINVGGEKRKVAKTDLEIETEKQAAADKERKDLLEDATQRMKDEAAKKAWTPKFFAGILRRILESQHHDTIATLDSFIQRIVRSFPLEMGFQRELAVLDDYGEAQAVRQAVDAILAADSVASGSDVVKAFGETQGNAAVRSVLSKIEKIAKDGRHFLHDHPDAKGWTYESMRKALGIEEKDLKKPDLSALPRTGKGKDPFDTLAKRVDDCEKDALADGDIFGGKPGELVQHLLAHPDATSYTYETPNSVAKTIDCKTRDGADAVRAAARYMIAKALDRKLKVFAAELDVARTVEGVYDRDTRKKGQLTFGDFIDCQQTKGDIDKEQRLQNLQFRLDSKFDHWALDEFQDTSMPQWASLRDLVDAALADGGRSVMAVGDLKQSIYAWRGGDDRPFQDLDGKIGNCLPLVTSHRYGQNTADFINAVFGPGNIELVASGRCAEAVKKWRQACWQKHEAVKDKNGEPKRGDYVEIVGVAPDADFGSDDDGDSGSDDDDDNLNPKKATRYMAPALCECVKELWESHKAANSTETIGILVRNNGDGLFLAEKIRATKTADGEFIPVVWEGVGGVLDAPAVHAVLELLRLADHPEDTYSWKTVNELFPVRSAVFPDKKDAAQVSAAVAELLSKHGLSRTIRTIVADLAKSGKAPDARSMMRLEELVRQGTAFEARREEGGVDAFCRYLENATDRDAASSSGVVRILTIHRSKGLSIDHVIVPIPENDTSKGGLLEPDQRSGIWGDGWFFKSLPEQVANAVEPIRKAREAAADKHLLEELRTWYVALTRAKKSTHVFMIDGDEAHGKVQCRTLLLKPFPDYERQTCDYGTILYSIGTMPAFGRKKSDAASEPPEWEWKGTDGGRFIIHETPSTHPPAATGNVGKYRQSNPFGKSFGEGARRGTEEHAEYAKIRWIDPDAPETDREKEILAAPGWREAFIKTPGAVLWRERSYELFDKERSVWQTGTFDRVVFRGDGGARNATIYDFKTNENKCKTIGEFEELMLDTYRGQMDHYRSALSRLCGIEEKSIRTILLLKDTMTSVEVPAGR